MKTLAEHFGAEWQNNVKPGALKLSQFRTALGIQKTPKRYAQEKDPDPIVYVKLFDPCSNWTWYITEWDIDDNEAFGFVVGHEREFGYVSLVELSEVKGRFGIGIELDMHFPPQRLSQSGARPDGDRPAGPNLLSLGEIAEAEQSQPQPQPTTTMSDTDKTIPTELETQVDKLLKLATPHIGTVIFQRIQSFVLNKTGSKLQPFINDATRTIEERAALVAELTKIIEQSDWEKLPAVASGQAAPTKPAPAPAPRVAPISTATPPMLTPAPTAPVNGKSPAARGEPFTVPTNGVACTPTPVAAPIPADPMAAILAGLKALMPTPPAPAAPQIDEVQVRRLVRAELAVILSSLADALK